jgi:hypothetical protein
LVINVSIDRTHFVDIRYRSGLVRPGGPGRPFASIDANGIGNPPTSCKRSVTMMAPAR